MGDVGQGDETLLSERRWFAQRASGERATRVAEARQHDGRAGEVVVGGVAAHRDENRQVGSHCGVDTDPAVLDDEALGRVEAEVGEHLEVDVGSRLLWATMSPAKTRTW